MSATRLILNDDINQVLTVIENKLDAARQFVDLATAILATDVDLHEYTSYYQRAQLRLNEAIAMQEVLQVLGII